MHDLETESLCFYLNVHSLPSIMITGKCLLYLLFLQSFFYLQISSKARHPLVLQLMSLQLIKLELHSSNSYSLLSFG